MVRSESYKWSVMMWNRVLDYSKNLKLDDRLEVYGKKNVI